MPKNILIWKKPGDDNSFLVADAGLDMLAKRDYYLVTQNNITGPFNATILGKVSETDIPGFSTYTEEVMGGFSYGPQEHIPSPYIKIADFETGKKDQLLANLKKAAAANNIPGLPKWFITQALTEASKKEDEKQKSKNTTHVEVEIDPKLSQIGVDEKDAKTSGFSFLSDQSLTVYKEFKTLTGSWKDEAKKDCYILKPAGDNKGESIEVYDRHMSVNTPQGELSEAVKTNLKTMADAVMAAMEKSNQPRKVWVESDNKTAQKFLEEYYASKNYAIGPKPDKLETPVKKEEKEETKKEDNTPSSSSKFTKMK